MRFTKFVFSILVLGVVITGIIGFAYLWPLALNVDKLQDIKTGDLIFQTSTAPQSMAVLAGTGSTYSHVGILHRKTDGSLWVLEAGREVWEVPLADWVRGGYGNRFAIYRDKRLQEGDGKRLFKAAAPYLGKSYDYIFWFENDELYCSELPYLMYKGIGLSIGKVQKIGELNIDNVFSQSLMKERWHLHPRCQSQAATYESCRKLLLEQELVSPASIAEDPNLTLIYSNYPF